MALFRCGAGSNELNIASGTNYADQTAHEYTINVGFKPRIIYALFGNDSNYDSFSMGVVYVEGAHNSEQYRFNTVSGSGNAWFPIPTTGDLRINSITDTGFTYTSYSSANYRYCYYVAVE